MNPNHLRTFLTVHHHLNFTHAADELGLSQPAVSRHIAQLEEALEVQLFDRHGKALFLTAAGETLVGEADKLLGAIQRTVEVMATHRTSEGGRLRIGASTTPGLYFLPAVLGAFHRRFPNIELHYAVTNSGAVQQMLVRNEIDLGFVGSDVDDAAIRQLQVDSDVIVCYASASHPLAERRRIEPRLLEGELWVMREAGSATRALVLSRLAALGCQARRFIELNGQGAVKALVAAGVGLSFTSRRSLRSELEHGELVELAVSRLRLKRAINLVRHVDKVDTPAMRCFLELAAPHFERGDALST